jgi:hypothetical protein
MRRSYVAASSVAAGIVLTVVAIFGADRSAPATEASIDLDARMRQTAASFLASLSPDLRDRATPALDSPARTSWHYLPVWAHPRDAGVMLGDLSDEQRVAAYRMLEIGLSDRGYLKAAGIVHLDDILRPIVIEFLEREGEQEDLGLDDARQFGSDFYLVAVFGDPTGQDPWGWRFEGHHLSLNFTSVDGLVVGTPTFMGSNPARIQAGPEAGWRVLAGEEDLGRAFLASLAPDERSAARIAGATPADIMAGPGAKDRLSSLEGVTASGLRPDQRSLLRNLIEQYVGNLHGELAAAELAAMEAEGFGNVHFAWAGSTAAGELLYYRVHGPTLLIEFDNTLNSANHIHTIFRGRDDLGMDLLKQHYESSPHHRK